MNIVDVKEIVKELKSARFPGLIILSFIILPFILPHWNKLFPDSWAFPMNVFLITIWVIAVLTQWISNVLDKRDWRTKTILANYLKKYKRRSIDFLTTEWDAKKQFSEKHIYHLLAKYPDELRRVQIKGKGIGVGLV